MDYADLVNAVTPGIGAPSFIVEEQIRNAVIELCEDSWIWEEDLAAITTGADEATYALATNNGTIIAVKSLKDANDYPVDHTVAADFASITLTYTPSSAFAITPRVVLIPEPDSTDFEDFIFYRHREAIIAGAKGKLFDLPNRTWTDGNSAGYFLRKFKQGITRANMRKNMGRTGDISVQMRPFV